MPYDEIFCWAVTNVALGLGVVLCVLVAAVGIGQELLTQLRQRRMWHDFDRDLCDTGGNYENPRNHDSRRKIMRPGSESGDRYRKSAQ